MSKGRKMLLILGVCLAVIAAAAMTINFGADMVREKVSEAVTENLDSQITIGSVSGNPFKGYEMRDISLSADGAEIFSAGSIRAKVSVLALLTGSPPLSLLEIRGFASDVDKINRLIPRIKRGDEGGQMPLSRMRILDSTLISEWAEANISEVALSFNGSLIDIGLDVMIDDLPVKGKLVVSMEADSFAIRKMNLDIGQGKLSSAGTVTPVLSLEGNAKDLDIARLINFWPKAEPDLYKGLLSTGFSAKGTWQDPEISGDLDYSGTMISGIPVETATARWKFLKSRLDVADLDVRLLGFPLKGDLAFLFAPSSPPRMRVDLKGAAADLESIARVSGKIEGLSGTLDEFSVFLEGLVFNPEGKVTFRAGKLGFKEYSTSDTSISANIRGGNINLSGKSVFEGAPLAFGGTVNEFMTKPEIALQGTLRSLSLASVKKIVPALKGIDVKGVMNADYRIAGTAPDIAVSGKVWSNSMSVGEYSLSSPSTSYNYALKEDSLAFSDLKGGWKSASISGNGRITNLSSENRTGDIVVRAAKLDSAFFASLYPPVAEYRIKGDITVEAWIKGALSGPSVRVSLLSPALSAMDNFRFVNLSAGTDIPDLKGGVPADLRLDIKADSAAISGAALESLKVELEKKGKVVTIKQGSAAMGTGTLSAAGSMTVEEPFEKTALNISVKAANIDLEKISFKDQKGSPMAGILTGDLAISGNVENPRVALNASAPFIAASGVRADSLKVKLSGNMDKVSIQDLSGKVGDGSIAVTGDVRPAPFAADLAVDGKNLDLKPMLVRFEKLEPYNITGTANLAFKGHFEKGGNSGTGNLTSPSVRFMGMAFTDIVLPMVLEGDRLVSANEKGKLYGGNISGNGSLNLPDMTFNEEVEVTDTDIDALMKDAFKLKGRITGKARLSANISGTIGEPIKYSGSGLLTTGQGMLSGFKGVDLLTSIHGTKGVQYLSIYAPFNLETGRLILREDTLVKAPAGDPIYRHLSASGPVGPEKRLNLACSGNVNVRVFNALIGGATGGLSGLAATQDIVGLLKGTIEGAGSVLKKDDFRDVSFNVKGTFEKPGISNVKISGPEPEEPGTEPAELAVEEQSLQDQVIQQLKPDAKPIPIPIPVPVPAPAPAPIPAPVPAPVPAPEKPAVQEKVLEQIVPDTAPEPAVEEKVAPVKEPEPLKEDATPAAEVKEIQEQEPEKIQAETVPAPAAVSEDVQPPQKQEPVKEEPAPEEPVKEEPVKEEPVKEEPVKDEPVKEEPAAEEPVKEEPAAEEPVKEEPAEIVQETDAEVTSGDID